MIGVGFKLVCIFLFSVAISWNFAGCLFFLGNIAQIMNG